MKQVFPTNSDVIFIVQTHYDVVRLSMPFVYSFLSAVEYRRVNKNQGWKCNIITNEPLVCTISGELNVWIREVVGVNQASCRCESA